MARTGQALIAELRAELDEPYESNWSDANLLMWINKGIVRLVSASREQRAQWFEVSILSTDSASTIRGETYTPSTQLKPTVGQTIITLPPNCLEVVKLQPTDQDDLDNGCQFVLSRPTSSDFIYATRVSTNTNLIGQSYLYYVYGTRYVKVAPAFAASFNVELRYIAMPDEITFTDSPSTCADWMLDLAVLYAHARALNAIKHNDYASAMQYYVNEEKRMMSLNRPRAVTDPILTESVFDGYDEWTDW